MSITAKFHVEEVLKTEEFARDRGIEKGMEHLRGVAVDRTPIDRGDLRNSAVASFEDGVGAVSYDTKYAVRQHEEMDYHHDTGQAKYLESAANDERQNILDLVAAEIRRGLA